ncbi:uncharacterized protein LOC135814855 isoform X1 [Sycon ciliatum]|uniref:uncharacterized protein LOC135814855 isoform X1 n=1 Tax=Sycon ciliatum TaxID=27933 RepID=UPI0031F7060A
MDHLQPLRENDSGGSFSADMSPRSRKQGTSTIHGSPSPAAARKSTLAGSLDLSQLTPTEQQCILAVIQRSEEAEKKVSNHCRKLQDQQSALLRRSKATYHGACLLCCKELDRKQCHVCIVCDGMACQHCTIRRKQHAGTKTAQAEVFCKACALKQQIFLTSSAWRKYGDRDADEDIATMPGYGMLLVCGLKCDGGVLRTFVVEAPVGGTAFQSGIMENDEVLEWCDELLIGSIHRSVLEKVQQSCRGRISVTVRRYVRGHEEERTVWVDCQSASSVSADALAQRMLIDPRAVGFPDGLFQATSGGDTLPYPNGRIKLKLKLVSSDLTVMVVEAERLPVLKPGVGTSPSVSVNLNGQNSSSTKQCLRAGKTAWHEELFFRINCELSNCILKVSVKTPKQFFGKATLGECVIKLEEALLNDSAQWYAMQPSLSSSSLHRRMALPTEWMRKEMASAHRKQRRPNHLTGLASSQPDLSFCDTDQDSFDLTRYPARGGRRPSNPTTTSPVLSRPTFSLEAVSDSEVSKPKKKKSSTLPRGPKTVSPLVGESVKMLAGISLGHDAPRSVSPGRDGNNHRISSLPCPIYRRPFSHQDGLDSESELSSTCPSPQPQHRRQQRGSFDGLPIPGSRSPRGSHSPFHYDSGGEYSSSIDEPTPQPLRQSRSKSPQQRQPGQRSRSGTYSTGCVPGGSTSMSGAMLSGKHRQLSLDHSHTDSPHAVHPRRSVLSVDGGSVPGSPTLPLSPGRVSPSLGRRRGRWSDAFGSNALLGSDVDSLVSSFSEMSGCEHLSAGGLSILTATDGAVKNTSISLTFTCTNSRKLLVTVNKVTNFVGVTEHENVKLANLSGVGVKITMLCVSGGRQKHKTRLQQLGNCIEFDQQFPFDVHQSMNHYTIKLYLIAKKKRRTHLSRAKSIAVAYRLIALQDVAVQQDSPHTETFQVFAKSNKASSEISS